MKNTDVLERAFIVNALVKQAETLPMKPVSPMPVHLALPLPIISALVSGGVRSLMDTPEDKEKERGRFHRFARGAAYGGLVPIGAQLGGGLGLGMGMLAGGAAGSAAGNSPEAVLAGAGIGGAGGATAGAAAGGVGTFALLRSLLGK
jgi:hypothetical protein